MLQAVGEMCRFPVPRLFSRLTDNFIGMGNHLRIPEIQLIPASVIYPSAMPFEKAVIT